MRTGTLSILKLLLLAVCNANGSSADSPPQSPVVPMNAQAWSIAYSPGMPPHPTDQAGGGWYFDFPTDPNSVHYVLAAVNMAASSYVDASILVTTTQSPVFCYNLQPDNTCIYPAAAGTCPNPSSTYLLPGLFSRSFTPPTSSTAAVLKITLEESAASGTAIAGLHMLPFMAFGMASLSGIWSAQVGYPSAWAEL